MPIFMDSFENDEALIQEIAVTTATYWNENGGMDFGFQVFVAKDNIKEMSRGGDEVLAAFFPEEPGPFKRVATALVMARLAPLFSLAAVESTDDHRRPISAKEERVWQPRMAFLLLEPALAAVRMTNGESTGSMLDNWHGFPSLHSKAEFMFWLEWLCDYPSDILLDEAARLDRRGRMVLGTSLILEATYYQDGHKSPICGSCDRKFFENCGEPALFTFDAQLRAPS